MSLVLMALAAPAQAALAHQGPFPPALASYRADRGCAGDSYATALSAIDTSLVAYHVADPAQPGVSVAKGMLAAAQLNDLAAAAAAKGCRPEATETWRQVLRSFDGPAFAAYQQRAVAGLRSLR